MRTIERIIRQRIESRLKPNKVVLIFGARRVGKTTLLGQIINNYSGKVMVLNGEDNDAIALMHERSTSTTGTY